MEETAQQYNISSKKTLHKDGVKSIVIREQWQEKCRVSLILYIVGDGKKLVPFVIFKYAHKDQIYKLLLLKNFVKEKKCILVCNNNAWSANLLAKKLINLYIYSISRKLL